MSTLDLCKGYSGPSVPFGSIDAPKSTNLRSVYNNIPELATQIHEQGLIEPLVLKPNSDNSLRFNLIAGFRRYYAIDSLKPSPDTLVPAIQKIFKTEGLEKLAQLSENTGKEDLKNYDIAVHLFMLENEYKLRRSEIVKESGMTATKVSQLISCLKPIHDGGLAPDVISIWKSAPSK